MSTDGEERTTERLTVYLPGDLRLLLRKLALDEGTTASRLVEALIREALAARAEGPAVAALVAAATALVSEDPTTAAGDGVAAEALREAVATYERRAGASR